MVVENFHSKVKRHPSYLANIANRRIDHLINVLLKIEESEFLDSQKKEHWNSANRWTQKEESRHHRAVMISDTDVEDCGDSNWRVKSQSIPGNICTIKKLRQACPQSHCTSFNCPVCGCCRDMYECSCFDFATGHLCKHIHKVSAISTSHSTDPDEDTAENDCEANHPNSHPQVQVNSQNPTVLSVPAEDPQISSKASATQLNLVTTLCHTICQRIEQGNFNIMICQMYCLTSNKQN
ncbi:uncharacterized protein LOC134189772 isoform X2 [Corticium candelabrum]|uniref:uncharacterized protein LOC134189772 isoform X2 n=1 Tax=Corticium candelabrum TaxID=121492 RepID=UPI002E276DB9|nr:uncharacterized protein LOC134189772 isoform X2 [Corticium candelabrum]